MKAAGPPQGAVVTGGGRGLGRAIARLLAQRGHGVLVTDVDGEAAAAVATEIGGRAISAVLDVRDDEACIAVAALAVTQFGRLDVWVNNAGILRTEPVWETDAADRRLLMEVNALGTMNGTLAALGPMRSAGRGHVVNIVSLAGLVAVPGEAVYAATKHAALGFTLSTAADLRAAGEKGIALSAICPDGIWTPMLHDRLHDPHAAMSFSGRLLQPDEVVSKVAQVLDRPRSVTAIPAWRGPQVRLADHLPDFALRLAPLIVRSARRRQKKYARDLGPR